MLNDFTNSVQVCKQSETNFNKTTASDESETEREGGEKNVCYVW